jgi:type II secretory pathway pseudopilin PulG
MKTLIHAVLVLFLAIASLPAADNAAEEIQSLRQQLAQQRAQIEQLRSRLDEQGKVLDRLAQGVPAAAQQVVAAVAPAKPAPASDAKSVDGFQFSGDFRLRLDSVTRTGNDVAAPVQNVRGRYRLRLNIDKDLDPRFRFHMQLSTGPFNNPGTADQDMGGITARHPFSIAEAYVDFRPNSKVTLRGGRAAEVFADSMRFLWDDDQRFNGFSQTMALPLAKNTLGFTSVELRAGEYILSNPAIYILPASSPFVSAGYQTGQKVRGADLFHPGIVVKGNLGSRWSHQIFGGVELYRNPNQIQLASTAAGFPVLVSGTLGLTLSGPLPGTGNATTTPGGAIYAAPSFHVSHLGYRLERKALNIGAREMPAWLDFQVSRNHGAASLRDAFMASANLGNVAKRGDVRALYQFSIKDANSMISQFTDDNLGTGSGVNIATHAIRFDLGLTRFLQWQNILFIQNQRRASNPSEQFFVPLGRGANATVRYQSQLAFTF